MTYIVWLMQKSECITRSKE